VFLNLLLFAKDFCDLENGEEATRNCFEEYSNDQGCVDSLISGIYSLLSSYVFCVSLGVLYF
jgi:hypothetical protein